MDKQKLLELASALVHAGLTNKDEEILKIFGELAAVMGRGESGNGGAESSAPPPEEKDKTGFLNFTKQEILKMPTKFRKYFIAADKLVHVRRRKRSSAMTSAICTIDSPKSWVTSKGPYLLSIISIISS